MICQNSLTEGDAEIEFDADGNPIEKRKKKDGEPGRKES